MTVLHHKVIIIVIYTLYRDFRKPWLQFQVGHVVEQVLAGVNAPLYCYRKLISPKFTKAQLFKHSKCLLYEGTNNIYHAYPHL